METEIITRVKDLIADFTKNHSEELSELLQKSGKIIDACQLIERSWSGSFAGWHGKMYYQNFETPPLQKRFSGMWGGRRGLHRDGMNGNQKKSPQRLRDKLDRIFH